MTATTIPCNFTSREDLLPYLTLPQPELHALVAECHDVCRLAYGDGNPDLAGIGVIISYVMGIILAVILGPLTLFESYLLRAFWRDYGPTRFSVWLLRRQNTSLWSQLFFALTISVTCSVRIFEKSCPLYERVIISQVVGVTLTGLSFALSAVYERIEQIELFIFLYLTTVILSTFAILENGITIIRFTNILKTCLVVSREQRLPWGRGAFRPFSNRIDLPMTLVFFACTLALNGIWGYLRLQRKSWMPQLAIARPKPRYRILLTLLFLISLALLCFACEFFHSILVFRNTVRIAWDGRAIEDVWGIGQIGATLIWAPLLFELGYSLVKGLWRRQRGQNLSDQIQRRKTV